MFLLPFGVLFYVSFLTYTSGQVIPSLPLTLSGYIKFFSDSYYPAVILRSFRISIITTVICVIVAYPVAFFMSRINSYAKAVMMVLITLPLISGVMVQTVGLYGMMTAYGPLNNFLVYIGLIKKPVQFLGQISAVVIGLVQGFLPYMVFPIMNVLQVIPANVLEAAESLGANKFRQFIHITLPMSLGGVFAGSLLVFGACLNSYATPDLLGRGKIPVIGTAVYQHAMLVFNWPFASVIAMLVLFIAFCLVTLTGFLTRDNQRKGAAAS
jgi:ABC-type spermidine/putrescine transport system permease subunit I